MSVRKSFANNLAQPFYSKDEAAGPTEMNQQEVYYGPTNHCSFHFSVTMSSQEKRVLLPADQGNLQKKILSMNLHIYIPSLSLHRNT